MIKTQQISSQQSQDTSLTGIPTLVDLARILDAAGIVSSEEFQELEAQIDVTGAPSDTLLVLDYLRSRGRLTQFQANSLTGNDELPILFSDYVLLEPHANAENTYLAQMRGDQRIVELRFLSLEPGTLGQSDLANMAFHRLPPHPNIAGMLEVTEANGLAFVVQEHVEGENLAEVVQQNGPFPVPEAVECLVQVARGLSHAHERGFIHHHLDPSKLSLDSEGNIRIHDICWQNVLDAVGNSEVANADHGQSRTSKGKGKGRSPSKPARSTKQPAGPESDLHNVGRILYYLLTGIEAPSQEKGSVYLRSVRDEVPPALDRLMASLLSPRQGDHPMTAFQVIEELEAIASGSADAESSRSIDDIYGSTSSFYTADLTRSSQNDESVIRQVLVGAFSIAVVGLIIGLVILLNLYS